MSFATLAAEAHYTPEGAAVAATMAFVVFSLFNIVLGLSTRSETNSVFSRDILADRRQLMLYGLALLLTFLPTELGFTQRILGLASLNADHWVVCIVLAVMLLLVTEVIKFFVRRSRRGEAAQNAAKLTPAVNA